MNISIHPSIARRDFLKAGGTASALAALSGLASAQTNNAPQSTMKISRNGSRASTKAPAERFTGSVRVDALFEADAPARGRGASVTFEPGARTNWHTHPLGQTLVVVSGCGLVQRSGGPIETVNPGDVVWFPPGVKHWHGATPTTAMTHIAITEHLDGKTSDWFEKVTDEQYEPQTGKSDSE
jgi:quercetin dioxygenase-like cupin family protein